MTVGQKVMRLPQTFDDFDFKKNRSVRRPIRGTVVYIHPKGRFHVVEFELAGGKVRESFWGVED